MADIKEVIVPDLGGASDVDVIEVAVAIGDSIAVDDSLITLESDKASMDVPSPYAGKVSAINVKVGDKVNEGSVILSLELISDSAATATDETPSATSPATDTAAATKKAAASTSQTVIVPDLGGADDVDVIEVMVNSGDEIAVDDSLITLESDKASMDVPSPYAGKVVEMKLKVGDKVSEGDVILTLQTTAAGDDTTQAAQPQAADLTTTAPATSPATASATAVSKESTEKTSPTAVAGADIYAGPGVRRLAREQGVDLHLVTGSGRKGRIVREDVEKFLSQPSMPSAATSAVGSFEVLPPPQVDFAKFGQIDVRPLSKIKKISGKNLHRNWVTVPHVTQFDEADITNMEDFRQQQKSIAAAQGVKLTPLVFIMKAVVATLQELPQFNASLDASGENLIMKQYFHIGVAVDTPNGLVVPVIRDVDKKGCFALATELGAISKKARDKGLMPQDMQGGCFSISSLGGISGTAFTPIVNLPEVAILGVSKSSIKPIYIDGEFVPRLMLPLSLSYDHRVIDGADAARFTRTLVNYLSDIRQLLL